jgi:hypothetical protein
MYGHRDLAIHCPLPLITPDVLRRADVELAAPDSGLH